MKIFNALPFFKFKRSPVQLISENWSERSSILEEDVNLFVWQRTLDKDITSYLERLLNMPLQDIRGIVDVNNLDEQLASLRNYWDEKTLPNGDEFWNDVRQITIDFLKFSQEGRGTLHLKVVSNDACKKFHVDGYSLRLFSSYLGPGTEWLPEHAVNRHALGTTNTRIVNYPSKIQRMGTGHVGILKGEIPSQHTKEKGIVHRSPMITQTNTKRIILRIDI